MKKNDDASKITTISELKEIFEIMCNARRRLKPILRSISQEIDNNVFIEADSDEVQEILKEILKLQEKLEQTSDLKKAVSSKKLATIDDAIKDMDRKQLIHELKDVLSKFKTLICDSEDNNEIDAAKKIQKQAKKLSLKAEKMNADQFKIEGNKFIDVAEKIENPATFSANSYLEIQRNFPDNPLLVYMLMKQSLHFEGSRTVVPTEPEKHLLPEKINKRIDKIQSYVKKNKALLTPLFIDENIIEQIAKPVKKRMTVKSLNNKLREFSDGRDSVSNPILHNFCKGRIYSPELFFEDKYNEKTKNFIPTIVEKLYNWGIFTKLQWQDFTFYYLTDNGYELLTKILSIKESKMWSKSSNESSDKRIAACLRRFMLFSAIWSLKMKKFSTNKLGSELNRFWIRSATRVNEHTYHVVFAFSLLFFDDNWMQHIDSFVKAYEEAVSIKVEVKSVFLVSNLESKQLDAWIKVFKSLGIKNIYKYLITKDGFQLVDAAGKTLTVDEWIEKVSLGKAQDDDATFDFDSDIDHKDKDESFDINDAFKEILKELDNDVIDSDNILDNDNKTVDVETKPKRRTKKIKTETSDETLTVKRKSSKKSTKKSEIDNNDDKTQDIVSTDVDDVNDKYEPDFDETIKDKITKTKETKIGRPKSTKTKTTKTADKKTDKKTKATKNADNVDVTATIADEAKSDEDNDIDLKSTETTIDYDTTIDVTTQQNIDDNKVSVTKSTENNLKIERNKNVFEDLPDEDRFLYFLITSASSLLTSNRPSRAMLFMHLMTMQNIEKYSDWTSNLCLEVGYLLDDPMCFNQLRNFDPFNFWDNYYAIPHIEVNELYDYLNLAAIIKSFFAPPEPMSFQLKNRWNQLNEDRSNMALKAYPSTKKLINLFKTFADNTHASFASCLNVDHSNAEIELTNAIESIKTMCERADVEARKLIKHPRTKGLVKRLYDTNGEVRPLMNIDSVSVNKMLAFCSKFTDEDLTDAHLLDSQNITIITEDFFSQTKIGDYLDGHWEKIKVDTHKREKFTGIGRDHQRNLFTQVLISMLKYAFAKKRVDAIKKSGQHSAPVKQALDILQEIKIEFQTKFIEANKKYIRNIKPDTSLLAMVYKILEYTNNLTVTINFIGVSVFITFIDNLTRKINGEDMEPLYNECLLGSMYLEVTKECVPITESYGVEAFSFTNRVKKFEDAIYDITYKEAVNSAYETAVRSCDYGILTLLEENYRYMIDRSDEELKKRRENVNKQVDRQLERIYHEFLDNLELDRNYDRITDQEKIDRYITIAAEAKEHYAATKNAGIYQRFINACTEEIAKAAQPHKTAMEQRLSVLEEKLESKLEANEQLNEKYPILAEIHNQLNLGNLTVAEDYMNRWNEAGGNFTSLEVVDSQNEPFDTFLHDYEMIFNACIKNKSESLEKIYIRMRGSSIKNRSTKDASDFVAAWQGLNTDTKSRAETSVIEILKHLSFSTALVDNAEKIPPNQWKIHVTFPGYRRSKAAYPHPFAVYGTDIAKKGLTIIYLASNRTADNIVETLAASVKSDCGVICCVDFALSLAERRKLAQAFKIRYDLKDIIVIDRVMAIYLTRFEDSVRGVKMLKTALPFARVQPYTTGGVVAPEMFIGRSKELAKIRDMTGPVFVYGGRQLGKSALLRQVRNIENDPEHCSFAFFIELKSLNSDKALEKIVRELKEAGLINKNETINNWDDFSFVMKDLLSGKAERYNLIEKGKTPKKLILLLDESDEFLASVENLANRAIDVLRELFETFSGKFKFVLAGLHKVIRFEKNLAFGNLDHISILPFTPTDALELLLKPMSFLGFFIKDEGLTSAIFSRANYYPGLIQYYCKMIVDAAGDNYTQRNFDVTKNPPYKLDDEYLKNMLGKRDFQDEINKKFQITLKLDDDNFYEIIALVIAMEYYQKNCPVHVSIPKIKETCFIYDIEKIANMSDTDLENLLGEMVELNLLRKIDDKYEFNRYAFWHMMGTESEIEERLTNYGVN